MAIRACSILLGVAALHSGLALAHALSSAAMYASRKPKAFLRVSCRTDLLETGITPREDLGDRQVDLLDVHTVPPKWRGDADAPQYQGGKAKRNISIPYRIENSEATSFSEMCLDQRVIASLTKYSNFPGLCLS